MPGNTWLIRSHASLVCGRKRACQNQPARRIGAGERRMRWDDFRRSDNVEDDRAASASRGGLPGGAGGLGLGTILIIGLISWYFGIDPSALLNGAQILTGGATPHQTAPPVVQTAPPRGRQWARSIARTIGASISTSPSSRICRTSSAPAPTARPASSRRPT